MLKLFLSNLKMMVRGRQALFWALVFPLMFTVIFGFFFGSGNSTVGTVALINQSNTELAKNYEKALIDSGVLKIKTDINESDARNLLKKNGKTSGMKQNPLNLTSIRRCQNIIF